MRLCTPSGETSISIMLPPIPTMFQPSSVSKGCLACSRMKRLTSSGVGSPSLKMGNRVDHGRAADRKRVAEGCRVGNQAVEVHARTVAVEQLVVFCQRKPVRMRGVRPGSPFTLGSRMVLSSAPPLSVAVVMSLTSILTRPGCEPVTASRAFT